MPPTSNEDDRKVETTTTTTAHKLEEAADGDTPVGDTPVPQFPPRHSRLEKLTSGFAPAFQEPEPDLLYDLGQDLSADLREHIKDPHILVVPNQKDINAISPTPAKLTLEGTTLMTYAEKMKLKK